MPREKKERIFAIFKKVGNSGHVQTGLGFSAMQNFEKSFSESFSEK
jgi:hypothetical protein